MEDAVCTIMPFKVKDPIAWNSDPFWITGSARQFCGIFLVFLCGFRFHCVWVDGERGLDRDNVDKYSLRLYSSLLNICGYEDDSTCISIMVRDCLGQTKESGVVQASFVVGYSE